MLPASSCRLSAGASRIAGSSPATAKLSTPLSNRLSGGTPLARRSPGLRPSPGSGLAGLASGSKLSTATASAAAAGSSKAKDAEDDGEDDEEEQGGDGHAGAGKGAAAAVRQEQQQQQAQQDDDDDDDGDEGAGGSEEARRRRREQNIQALLSNRYAGAQAPSPPSIINTRVILLQINHHSSASMLIWIAAPHTAY
jgi:hypothetical protein